MMTTMSKPSAAVQRELLAAVSRAREQIESGKIAQQVAVVAALDAGVPATEIAAALNLSRYRVYQIRDGK